MQRELILSPEPIDEALQTARRRNTPQNGAVVTFSGIVRGTEGDAPIEALFYEAFEEMARHQFHLLFNEMAQRWPISSVRLIHRIGRVPVAESSLWVEIAAPHRGEALQACEWLIHEMKRKVPIWKHPVPSRSPALPHSPSQNAENR